MPDKKTMERIKKALKIIGFKSGDNAQNATITARAKMHGAQMQPVIIS